MVIELHKPTAFCNLKQIYNFLKVFDHFGSKVEISRKLLRQVQKLLEIFLLIRALEYGLNALSKYSLEGEVDQKQCCLTIWKCG